jgi:hypothetical protein
MLSLRLTCAASGLIFVFASAATAQRSRQDLEPRDGACFYEDANFQGNSFCVNAGETLQAMPRGMNDRVSSIRTFGRSEVTVYRDESFGGGSVRFDSDVPDLQQANWNDRISSVQVRSNSYGYRGGYSDPSARGASRVVRRAYRDVLGREPDAESLQYYRDRIVDEGWTEAQVRRDLRRSDEYKARTSDETSPYGTTRSAQNVVRRAYRDVLGREPDTQGMQYYRDRIVNEGWTEAQVRRDLRNSDEYKARISDETSTTSMTRTRAESVVRRAYRSVLNREPDPGSEGYIDHVLRDGWTQADVERDLRRSAEYLNRNR